MRVFFTYVHFCWFGDSACTFHVNTCSFIFLVSFHTALLLTDNALRFVISRGNIVLHNKRKFVSDAFHILSASNHPFSTTISQAALVFVANARSLAYFLHG